MSSSSYELLNLWIFLRHRWRKCEDYKGDYVKNKIHLVIFHGSVLVSLRTFQPSFVYTRGNSTFYKIIDFHIFIDKLVKENALYKKKQNCSLYLLLGLDVRIKAFFISLCLSVCLSLSLSIYLSIYLSISSFSYSHYFPYLFYLYFFVISFDSIYLGLFLFSLQ